MNKIKLRKVLQLVIFLFSFLFLTVLVYYLYEPMVEPYNKLLIKLVPSQVFEIKNIIAYSVKGEKIFLYTRGRLGKISMYNINGLFLHANIIPVVAIFLATYIVFFASFNVAWHRKVFYLFASLFLLFATHLVHLILDCLAITPFFVFERSSMLAELSKGNVLMLFRFLEKIRIFFEQVERMIIPFFLWAIFCLKYVWDANKAGFGNGQTSD